MPPRDNCPACQRKRNPNQVQKPNPVTGPDGRVIHPREWQSYQLVDERKSNKPGFAFTPFERFCPLHTDRSDKPPSNDQRTKRQSSTPTATATANQTTATSTSRSPSSASLRRRSLSASAPSPQSNTTTQLGTPPASPQSRIPSLAQRSSVAALPSSPSSSSIPPSASPSSTSHLPRSVSKSVSMSTIHVTSSAATTTTTTSLDSDDQSAPRGRRGLLSQFIPLPTSKPSTHGSSSSTHELNQDHDPQHQELNEMHGVQLSDGTQSVLLDDSIQGVLNIDGAQEGSQHVQPNDINQDVVQQDDLVDNENALDSDTNQETSPESSANQESNDSPSNIHHDDDSVSQASHPTTAGAETEYDFGFDTETIASTTYMNSPPQTTTSTSPTSHLTSHLRTPRRRARKPIDMTNLTLLHHLLTTRLSDLQTHHLALLTPPPPPTPSSPLLKTHHTQAYKTSAREIIFLGRGIASSWSPVARGCKDRVLRDSLLLSLQRIDTLSARMKGVLGSVVRFEGGKVDEEGVVVSSAVEVVKAAEDALRDLEAARVMVWEKEEEGEEEEGGEGVDGVDGGKNVGEEEEKGEVDQVKVEEEEEVRVVELTGMEGMEEALKIAMKAASAVGN